MVVAGVTKVAAGMVVLMSSSPGPRLLLLWQLLLLPSPAFVGRVVMVAMVGGQVALEGVFAGELAATVTEVLVWAVPVIWVSLFS